MSSTGTSTVHPHLVHPATIFPAAKRSVGAQSEILGGVLGGSTAPRTGASYREIATKFHPEDFGVEALVRPHIRPPAFRKTKHAVPQSEALL